MADKKIIAILGLPGSGKSEAIKYLTQTYKWPKVYFGDITFDEIKKRKLEINEKNEKLVREKLRKKFGKSYYAKETLKKIRKIRDAKIILVESLYAWQEYLVFKKAFGNSFFTIAVYASPKIRYQRLAKRKFRPLGLKEARNRDYSQLENLEQGGPIAISDFTVNNETKYKNFYKQLTGVIKKISEL